MSKLRELVYDVFQRLSELTDDSDYSEDYVAELINQHRAKYLEREYSKRRVIPIDYRQTIVVPLESVDSSMDTSFRVMNKISRRTNGQLPNILTLNSLPAIHELSSLDRNLGDYAFVDKVRAKDVFSARFCPLAVYLDTDERLYFVSSSESLKMLKWITIDAVFEDPRDVLRFSYPDKTIGEALELISYPISKKIWPYMKADIVSELIGDKLTPADLQQSNADMLANPSPQLTSGESIYQSVVRLGM